jgi:hypothetical protein
MSIKSFLDRDRKEEPGFWNEIDGLLDSSHMNTVGITDEPEPSRETSPSELFYEFTSGHVECKADLPYR